MNKPLLQTNWPKLLDLALAALDTLPKGVQWSWGGGTALSIHLNHRVSYDIDIFLSDSEALRALSPQNNQVVRAMTDKWQQPGHYIKLERKEGEIDFIVSRLFTEPGTTPWNYKGRDLPLETVSEVLVKKLHWRGSRALARDIFDYAAAWQLAPESFEEAIAVEPMGATRVADHIRRNITRIKREFPQAVKATPTGKKILNVDLLSLANELNNK